MKNISYIGLGSNLTNPMRQVLTALEELSKLPNTHLLHHSSLYQSPPLGPPDQPDYINAVAGLKTALSPLELLDYLQNLEKQHGRVRKQKWQARTLDLDILLYNQQQWKTVRLTLPHPGLYQRHFVLYPLAECAPNLLLPNGQTMSEALHQCASQDLQRITYYEPTYLNPFSEDEGKTRENRLLNRL